MLDFCVIGGGIVGLAASLRLMLAFPGAGLVVLEKESTLARHQTGHNSGVIHAGIYYAPGSLKARLCRAGAEATKQFCTENGIRFETCGKLLVATSAVEVQRMDALFERAQTNGIECELIDQIELSRREPAIAGLGGIFVPATGIVDYRQVCNAIAVKITALGGQIELNCAVERIEEQADQIIVHASGRQWRARQMVACAGLQADRVAEMAGIQTEFQIVPFRGEYYQLPKERKDLIRSLIYPIPDPDLPFLGIHLTRMIDGSITVGPNAVLGFARELYPKLSVNLADVARYARFPGFWRVIQRNWRSGLAEMRDSLWKSGYLAACRKYCPSLTLADLQPYEAGIRAQAVMKDGSLVHDFLFAHTTRSFHVCNAPSPAATSAFPIGDLITQEVTRQRQALN